MASDEVLAQQAKEGNIKAFEELFERYKKRILNFVYRLIGNKETAEEVTQETFIKVYKNLDIYDPSKKFTSWLYTIARNLAKNALRDRKYFADISLEKEILRGNKAFKLKDVIADPSMSPASIVEDEELAEQAQKVLNLLPVKYREVITLYTVEKLTYKEIAEILGCSVANVSIILNKAKILFMKKLGIDTPKRGGKA